MKRLNQFTYSRKFSLKAGGRRVQSLFNFLIKFRISIWKDLRSFCHFGTNWPSCLISGLVEWSIIIFLCYIHPDLNNLRSKLLNIDLWNRLPSKLSYGLNLGPFCIIRCQVMIMVVILALIQILGRSFRSEVIVCHLYRDLPHPFVESAL